MLSNYPLTDGTAHDAFGTRNARTPKRDGLTDGWRKGFGDNRGFYVSQPIETPVKPHEVADRLGRRQIQGTFRG